MLQKYSIIANYLQYDPDSSYAGTMINLESGFRGGELLEVDTQQIEGVDTLTAQLVRLKSQLPARNISVEGTNGVKVDMPVRLVPLFGRGFELMHRLAPLGPMVYVPLVRQGRAQYQEAMLSPGYDEHGESRRPTVRAIPVNKSELPVTPGLWLPDPTQTMALAGAVATEKRGVGGHVSGTADIEHRLSTMGAVTLGSIELAASHSQHAVRRQGGSTATQLSGGNLGTIFAPGSVEGFDGFGAPIEYDGTTRQVVYMPDSYFDRPDQAFGALVQTEGMSPERFIGGLSMGVLAERGLMGVLDMYTKAMEENVGAAG
jgi:hypothetical protein